MLPQLSTRGGRKQACEVCRQRKRKCDGQLPACSTCRRTGAQCIYALRSSNSKMGILFHATPEVVPPVSVGQKTSSFHEASGSHTNPAIYSESFIAGSHAAVAPSDEQPVIETSRTADWSQADLHEDRRGYNQSTSHQSPSLRSTYDATVDHAMSGTTVDINTPSTSAFENPLCPMPPHWQAIDLCNQFFSTYHDLLPLVHQRTFMNKLKRDINLVACTPLFWIMIALASSYDRSPEMRDRRERWLKTAHAKLETIITSPIRSENTSMLQSAVWMVYESYARGDPTAAWLLLGRTCQIAGALELDKIDHKRLSRRAAADLRECSDIEIEERRKSMWCLFLLDRIISAAGGVPLTLDERRFLVSFPLPDEMFQQVQGSLSEFTDQRESFSIAPLDLLNHDTTSAMAAKPLFNHVLKASIVMGRVSVIPNDVHQMPVESAPIREVQLLNTVLKTFCAATMQPYETNMSLDIMYLWLVLMLQTSRMLILHPTATGVKGLCNCTDMSTSENIIYAFRPECSEAAQTVVATCRRALDTNSELLSNALLFPLMCVCIRILVQPRNHPESIQHMTTSVLLIVDRMGDKYPEAATRCRDAITRRLDGDESNIRTHIYDYIDYDCA